MRPSQILVATFSRPYFLLVERATRDQGITCVKVDSTWEAVSPLLSADSCVVLVVDAIQQEGKALDFCKAVQVQYPSVRALVLAGRSDKSTIANAVRAGASGFFLAHTPLDELMTLLANAIQGKPPSADNLFGRLWSALPFSPDKEGIYRTHAGERLSPLEAITRCQSLGLSVDETAEHLQIPLAAVNKISENAPKAKTASLFSGLGDLFPSGEEVLESTKSASSVKPLLSVFVLLLAILLVWKLLTAGGARVRAVTGDVTFRGAPLKCGLIRFIPEGSSESPRPIASGEIRDGRYKVKSTHGSDGGAYRVVISGFTGVPIQVGPVVDPLGDQLFPDNIRSVTLPCSNFTFDVVCEAPPTVSPQTPVPVSDKNSDE